MAATVADFDTDEIASIREAVRALCAKFPGEYWRALDRARGDRHHGGDPGERLQRRGLPRADVRHGHRAAPRQPRAEGAFFAADRARRAQTAGVRRYRADVR